MLGDFSCRVLLQIMGYAYPGYLCFKDLRAGGADDKLKDWARFLVVMAAFTALSPLLDAFLFFVPFYYEAKLAFPVYLWWGGLAGTRRVYGEYLEPLVARYEPLVDAKLEEGRRLAAALLSTGAARVVGAVQQRAAALLASAAVMAQQQQQAQGLPAAAPAAEPRGGGVMGAFKAAMGSPRAAAKAQ